MIKVQFVGGEGGETGAETRGRCEDDIVINMALFSNQRSSSNTLQLRWYPALAGIAENACVTYRRRYPASHPQANDCNYIRNPSHNQTHVSSTAPPQDVAPEQTSPNHV